MVSQAQRLREQQRELRGEDLRGLTKVEQLKLQQEALKKGIPRRRLLKIREQQARLRKAEASPEVKKIKRLVTNQKNIIENFKNQIKQSEKDIARLEKEIAEGDFSVDNRRIRNNSMQIERARIRAIKRVLPNLEKSLIELEKIKKQSVNAVFVGREDLAITLSKEATKFARDISGNAREIVDVAVRNEERRLAFQRRRQRRRERRREAIRELKELGFTSTEIKQLRKTGAFKITETQAEKLSPVSRRALGVDLKSFKGVSPTTYAGMTLITGEQVLVTPDGVPIATAFIPEKIKKPETISPDIRSFGVLNERVELVGDQLVLVTPDFGADFRTETISTDLGAKTKLLPTTVPELEKRKKFELSGEANRLLILRKAQQDAQTELESKITKLAEDSARKAQLDVSAENARLTSLVESGSLSVEVANKRIKDFAKKVQTREENKLRKDAERISSDIQKDYQEIAKTEFAKIRTDTIRKVDKRDFIKIGVESAIIGAGLATLGPLGIPLGVGLLAFEVKRAGGIPEVIEVAKERPLSTTAGLVGGITGGLAVGGARFGKLNIDRLKINRAIDNAILIPKRAGITIEKAIKKYKIDKNEIPEIKELASRSVEIREVTVKLKGITPEDRKLIPKVEGKFLEFIGSDGRIIEVVSLGKIGFELKGKVYSRDVLQRAGGRLDEANREIFVRTISAKPDIRKGFKKLEAVNTLEKSEVKIIKKPKEEFDTAIFKTKTDIFRLGKPTKNQRALRKELSQSLKDLEKGLLFKPIIQRVGKKEKIGVFKDITSKQKAIDITEVSPLTFPLFKKTGVFVETGLGLGKQIRIPKPPKKTIKITKGDIRKLTEVSGVKLSAKQLAIQQQVAKTVLKTTAGLKQATRDIAKTIVKQDITKVKSIGAVRTGVTTTISPAVSITTREAERLDTGIISKQRSLLKTQQEEKQLSKQLLGTHPVLKQPQIIREGVIQKPQVRFAQLQIQKPVLRLKTLTGTTTFAPPKIPPIKPKIPKFLIGIPRISTLGIRKKDTRPYNVFIKGKKIASNLSKSTAKDFGSYVVDKSIAAQFKIKPARGKKIKASPFKVPPMYFELNINKFRKPRGVKPKRNIYIERKNRRLDTGQEVAQITAARFIASQRKLTAGKINIFGKI